MILRLVLFILYYNFWYYSHATFLQNYWYFSAMFLLLQILFIIYFFLFYWICSWFLCFLCYILSIEILIPNISFIVVFLAHLFLSCIFSIFIYLYITSIPPYSFDWINLLFVFFTSMFLKSSQNTYYFSIFELSPLELWSFGVIMFVFFFMILCFSVTIHICWFKYFFCFISGFLKFTNLQLNIQFPEQLRE